MSRRFAAALALPLLLTAALRAEEPKMPSAKEYDKIVIDTLKEVHNAGAELYNTYRDFGGAYRMYQGALLTIRPLLGYRPAAQKLIDEGLASAEKEQALGQKAFKLHETIEAVRAYLKNPTVMPGKTEAATKPDTTKPDTTKPDTTKPNATKPDTTKPETTKPNTTKPDTTTKPKVDETKKSPPTPQYELAPQPREKKETKTTTPNPISTTSPARTQGLAGKVMLRGQALSAAEVTLVSLDQAKPRVFTAAIKADGSYTFTETLPPGKYVVIVTARSVPEKYQTTQTSGLTFEVPAGPATYDIVLK